MKTIKEMLKLNKEYRKRFGMKVGKGKKSIVMYPSQSQEILAFFWEREQEERAKIKEKIKKMVKYRDLDRGGYNQALNDVLKEI